ncbi:MAG: hypothetical protein WC382_13330 [Methanoregulaceae archaeon]
MHGAAPAFPLRSAAALWPTPRAARFDTRALALGRMKRGRCPAISDERSAAAVHEERERAGDAM